MLVLTHAAATFTSAGPVGRGPGRKLGATMAVSAPGPDTVMFHTQESLGVQEGIIAKLDSESTWQQFVGFGARLYVMRDPGSALVSGTLYDLVDKRVIVEEILSREDALRAAAAAEATGTYLYLAGSLADDLYLADD